MRELAAKELKERVHLERELVKQQQQNVILQKQREVDRLEAQVDRHLLQQAQDNLAKPVSKTTLALVREEVMTPSPEVVELTEPDTPQSDKQAYNAACKTSRDSIMTSRADHIRTQLEQASGDICATWRAAIPYTVVKIDR